MRFPGSSLDSGFLITFSDSALDVLRLVLNSWFSAGLSYHCPAQAWIQVSGFWFQMSVWTCCARFSTYGFNLPAGLSCGCPALVRTPFSGFRFWFGLTPFASQFNVSCFQRGSRSIAQLQPDSAFRFPLSDSDLDFFCSLPIVQFLA